MNKEHSTKEPENKKEAKKKGRPKKDGALKPTVAAKTIKPEHYFFLRDGRVLKDIMELADTLETVDSDVFYHHVNDSRNDFSNWIKDIFEEKELSKEIHTVREPRKMQVIILKHLAKKRK